MNKDEEGRRWNKKDEEKRKYTERRRRRKTHKKEPPKAEDEKRSQDRLAGNDEGDGKELEGEEVILGKSKPAGMEESHKKKFQEEDNEGQAHKKVKTQRSKDKEKRVEEVRKEVKQKPQERSNVRKRGRGAHIQDKVGVTRHPNVRLYPNT